MDSFADTCDDPAEAYMLKKVYWQGKNPPFHNNDFPFTLTLRPRLGATKPLNPKSDQHEISPYNINALENRVVMRIEYMIREDESNRYFNKFSLLLLLKKFKDSK